MGVGWGRNRTMFNKMMMIMVMMMMIGESASEHMPKAFSSPPFTLLQLEKNVWFLLQMDLNFSIFFAS